AAVRELEAALPQGVSLPAATLAWIAALPGVTTVIPGARNVRQAEANAAAGQLLEDGTDLTAFDTAVREVYDRLLRADIHPRW
ncbi:MAG: aldo/keto reductase, partial [Microbacteriaceae bacterium]